MDRWFHGTHKVEEILAGGVDLSAPRHDVGDFGWGFYLTTKESRARNYGEVLVVEIDESRFARLENPYFLNRGHDVDPETDVERLFHEHAFEELEGGCDGGTYRNMITVNSLPDKRRTASQAIRDAFLAAGYAGIITDHDGGETVVFDATAILGITQHGETSNQAEEGR